MKLKTLFQSDESDRAVSPVIGVILMVAITVILAAVIGTFVLGLGDDIEQEVQAGATIDEEDTSATITYTSQGTADELLVIASDQSGNELNTTISSVGQSVTLDDGQDEGDTWQYGPDGGSQLAGGEDYQISVVAVNTSGSEDRQTVIRTTTVNLGSS